MDTVEEKNKESSESVAQTTNDNGTPLTGATAITEVTASTKNDRVSVSMVQSNFCTNITQARTSRECREGDATSVAILSISHSVAPQTPQQKTPQSTWAHQKIT